jgi:hypothetical protein
MTVATLGKHTIGEFVVLLSEMSSMWIDQHAIAFILAKSVINCYLLDIKNLDKHRNVVLDCLCSDLRHHELVQDTMKQSFAPSLQPKPTKEVPPL